MHIWHHAKYLPKDSKYGVNYGISLSIWDYLFGTAYMPKKRSSPEIGFEGEEAYPKDFRHQVIYPLAKKKKHEK
jgi:sterol desaturase/sphingolipid hydroxylase (fatty acid hydroxylase superfamily)